MALARVACNTANQGPCVCCWHAELGAVGKDYRANVVHAPAKIYATPLIAPHVATRLRSSLNAAVVLLANVIAH